MATHAATRDPSADPTALKRLAAEALRADGQHPTPAAIGPLVEAILASREIEGTLTFEFANGSTLSIYYEAPVSSDLVVQGPYWVVGGTGLFEGASGYGIIWYPIGQDAPFTLNGTLIR